MKRSAALRGAKAEDTTCGGWAPGLEVLEESKTVAQVLVRLKRRGLTERNSEFLLRRLARVSDDWEHDKEPWPQTVKRRKRVAKKLRDLAGDIANDPDLGQLSFDIRRTFLNGAPELGMVTLADLLRSEAEGLEPNDRIRISGPGGTTMTGSEFEKSVRPQRQVARRAYTLLAVFELVQQFASDGPADSRRAPNREAEILAGVLLGETIPPGTLTQLRKTDRRRYYRDG